MRERAKSPAKVWGLPWGFPGLDEITGGMHTGNNGLAILMARPGVGKSFFLGQVAVSVARYLLTDEGQQRYPDRAVKLVLAEMTAESFQERMVCAMAGVSQRNVRSGFLTPAQRRLYEDAARELVNLPIEYLDDSTCFADTRRFLLREGQDMAFFGVDYLGIHPGSGNHYVDNDDYKRVNFLSAGFREITKSVAPGLVLAQMNRNVESSTRKDKRPMLSDIRDSGKVEQDAGVIMGLYRPDLYLDVPDSEKRRPKPAELTVIKHRNGPLGTVELLWCPDMPGFTDISEVIDEVQAMTSPDMSQCDNNDAETLDESEAA